MTSIRRYLCGGQVLANDSVWFEAQQGNKIPLRWACTYPSCSHCRCHDSPGVHKRFGQAVLTLVHSMSRKWYLTERVQQVI